MRIVNIIGGLGNQMFQYAFALSLKKKFPDEEVLIDTSHFNYIFIKKWGASNLHNGYELEKVFPNATQIKKATAFQLMKVTWYMPNYLLSRVIRKYLPKRKSEFVQKNYESFHYFPEVFERDVDTYYEGVWEAMQYMTPAREDILKAYSHPSPEAHNSDYISKMESENSVGIHVRRGDYQYLPAFNGICDLDYYKKAISEIASDGLPHTYYIFSNDIKWCEENLRPLIGNNKIVFVTENTGTKSCWDMFLMTHCKNLIIANSSFSWWGAFLNTRCGRVIAPSKWVNRDGVNDIWLDEWIRL